MACFRVREEEGGKRVQEISWLMGILVPFIDNFLFCSLKKAGDKMDFGQFRVTKYHRVW